MPIGSAALPVQIFQRADDLIDRRPQALQQAQAGVGERYAMRGAVQQPHPKALFELPHRMAEGRGRNAEPLCGRAKAQVIGDSDERCQIVKAGATHC